MLRAWILSSTRWCSLSMYITPTVTVVVERLAGLAVDQLRLTADRQARHLERAP